MILLSTGRRNMICGIMISTRRIMKNWRPDGWDAHKLIPEFYDIRVLEKGEWVDRKLHSLNSLSELWAFEAGADAFFKALLERGLRIDARYGVGVARQGDVVIYSDREIKE